MRFLVLSLFLISTLGHAAVADLDVVREATSEAEALSGDFSLEGRGHSAYAALAVGTSKSESVASLRVGKNLANLNFASLAAGLFVAGTQDEATILGVNFRGTIYLYGAEFLLRDMWNTGLYLGPRAGLAAYTIKVTAPTLATSATASGWMAGFSAGYDLRFNEQHSVNFESTYLNLAATNMELLGTKIPIEAESGFVYQLGYMFRFL